MSNRTLKAIVAGLVVIVALPLIAQAFKPTPVPQIDDASLNPGMPVDRAQAMPAPLRRCVHRRS